MHGEKDFQDFFEADYFGVKVDLGGFSVPSCAS